MFQILTIINSSSKKTLKKFQALLDKIQRGYNSTWTSLQFSHGVKSMPSKENLVFRMLVPL
jgi:hypothetical protein